MRSSASRSLTDQHGEWCADCLKYFSPHEPREFHHVLTKQWVRNRFGSDIDFGWVVPAHVSCHRPRLQATADFTTTRFFARLDRETSPARREQLSRQFHDRGYYWLSVLANLDAMKSGIGEDDREQSSRRCEFALSSLAGVRGAQNLSRILMKDGARQRSPRIQLNLANLQAARGHELAAKQTLTLFTEVAGTLSKKEREGLKPGLLRRKAQLSRSARDASEAVRAAETQYSKDTALVIQGVLAVGAGEFRYVEESLEQLRERDETISWLYKAEEQFIRALFLILTGSEDYTAIYASLCVAQYIYVVLGLQMSISPELPLDGPVDRSWDWTPSDVLRSYFAPNGKNGMSDMECYQIRVRAITDSNLLERLLSPMWAA
jgi:hypothetical protein